MFILKNLLFATAKILEIACNLYFWVIILNAIFSWVNASPGNPIVNAVRIASDFVMDPIRHRFNLVLGMIDFTPIIVIMLISFLENFLVRTLLDISARL
ncbi:MAG: YggT family protein [bacterium]|nr:YggT family protein [bacterium]